MIGFERTDNTTLTIDLTQDINTIWKNMSKSSCRYAINKAKRDGVIINIPAEYHPFYKLDTNFRIAKGLPERNKILDHIPYNNSVLFVACLGDEFIYDYNKQDWVGGKLLAGQLYIYDKCNIRLLISASNRFEADKNEASIIGNANHLLVWESINYAKYREIKTFDLGGYNPEKYPTVAAFKKSFGGVVTPYYTYVKIYSKLLKSLKVII